MNPFHPYRPSKSKGPQYRHLLRCLSLLVRVVTSRAICPEESSVEHSLPAKVGNTQFHQHSAPDFTNIFNWETTHERPSTTQTPITNGMQHQR